MTTTELILAISAGVTLLLALAAFWAIWQNYNFRKEDKELSIKIQKIDRIISWAYEFRQVLLTSMGECINYLEEISHDKAVLIVNLQAQVRNREAQNKAVDDLQELGNLRKELRELQREEAEIELKTKDRSEHDSLFTRMLSVVAPAAAEHEVLKLIADDFGKGFRDLFEESGQSLVRVIELIESISITVLEEETEQEKKPFKLRQQVETLREELKLINLLCSNASSIKSLLLRYGSKLKL